MNTKRSLRKSFSSKIIGLTLCLALSVALTGCGGGDDSADTEKTIDMAAVVDQMKAVDSDIPEMTVVTSDTDGADATFSILSDMDYGKIDGFVYASSVTGSPEEIAIVKVKEKANVGDMMNSLKAHLESRKATFTQYSPEQVSMIDGAIVTYEGNYIVMAVADKSGAMQDVFKKAFE